MESPSDNPPDEPEEKPPGEALENGPAYSRGDHLLELLRPRRMQLLLSPRAPLFAEDERGNYYLHLMNFIGVALFGDIYRLIGFLRKWKGPDPPEKVIQDLKRRLQGFKWTWDTPDGRRWKLRLTATDLAVIDQSGILKVLCYILLEKSEWEKAINKALEGLNWDDGKRITVMKTGPQIDWEFLYRHRPDIAAEEENRSAENARTNYQGLVELEENSPESVDPRTIHYHQFMIKYHEEKRDVLLLQRPVPKTGRKPKVPHPLVLIGLAERIRGWLDPARMAQFFRAQSSGHQRRLIRDCVQAVTGQAPEDEIVDRIQRRLWHGISRSKMVSQRRDLGLAILSGYLECSERSIRNALASVRNKEKTTL